MTSDNSTLIVAASHGKRLSAFRIAADGSLSDRCVWADLGDGVPDGICIDAENAVWYADVPNKRCVHVREGGEVIQSVDLDRGVHHAARPSVVSVATRLTCSAASKSAIVPALTAMAS